jgi:glycosyltransferase involved in cell wall biosynthesis
MKIAFITETYPPEINGVALTVLSLVQHCRKLGHFVELHRPWQAQAEFANPERLIVEHLLPGARLPFYTGLRFGFPAQARLLKHWRKQRPDGVYIATEGPLGWSAVSAARALKIPVVTGLHTRFDDFMSHYGLWFLRRAAFAFMRRFHNRADATLVPTLSLQKMLQAQGFKRVERLRRGVDTQHFSPKHRCTQLRAAWGSSAAAPTVLFVGRIAPEKNSSGLGG